MVHRHSMSALTASSLCWYCCGTIPDSTSIGLPIKYVQNTGKFTLRGKFCSWPCVKSYNRDSNYPAQSLYYAYIRMLYTSVGNKADVPIASLPPREHLIEFGGTLTRDEFHKRGNETGGDILYVPEYLVDIRVHGGVSESPMNSQSSFKFGPMKIPETSKFTKPPKKDGSRGSKGKKDVVSMLASFGK